jgi:hypothetical protein
MDRSANQTGAGMIEFALRQAAEIRWQALDINKDARAGQKLQKPFCISPLRAERELARSRFEPDEFVEIYIDASLEECERRDPKGLYAKARRGELVNFTGIDSDYEPPEAPEIRLDTVANSPVECVDLILSYLDSKALHKIAESESSHGRSPRL